MTSCKWWSASGKKENKIKSGVEETVYNLTNIKIDISFFPRAKIMTHFFFLSLISRRVFIGFLWCFSRSLISKTVLDSKYVCWIIEC